MDAEFGTGRSMGSVHHFLGKAQHFNESARYDLAAGTLREGLQSHPDSVELNSLLCISLLNAGKNEECRDVCGETLRLDPEDLNAIFCLGRLAIVEGKHSEGEKHLLEGLAINPRNVPYLVEYARLMNITDNYRKSQKLLETALEIDPEHPGALSLLSYVQSRRLRLDGARASRGKALESDPDSAIVHLRTSVSATLAGRPFLGRYHAREALRMDPTIPGIEDVYLEADRNCRWLFLPAFYYSLLVDKIPGKQFGLYIIYITLLFGMNALGVPGQVLGLFVISYLAFCVYTWIARPLTQLWIKWRPPR
jgi:tetratricopeptide (TPR) repeat protein